MKLVRYVILFVLLLLFVFAVIFSRSTDIPSFEYDSQDNSSLIEMSVGGGFASIQNDPSLFILANGEFFYFASYWGAGEILLIHGKLTEQELIDINDVFKSKRFFSLNEFYNSDQVTDGFTTSISYNYQNFSKTVSSYHSSGPKKFWDIVGILNEVPSKGKIISRDEVDFFCETIYAVTNFNNYYKNNCLSISSMFFNDSSICSKMEGESDKGDCMQYFYRAEKRNILENGDVKDCLTIEDPYTKSRCYLEFARKTENESICYMVNEDYQYDIKNCVNGIFMEKAISRNNSELCILVSDETIKNRCYVEIAKKTNNSQICALASNSKNNERDMCYYTFAWENENQSLCPLIERDDLKQECLAWDFL